MTAPLFIRRQLACLQSSVSLQSKCLQPLLPLIVTSAKYVTFSANVPTASGQDYPIDSSITCRFVDGSYPLGPGPSYFKKVHECPTKDKRLPSKLGLSSIGGHGVGCIDGIVWWLVDEKKPTEAF